MLSPLLSNYSKDARLPVQLQRAMAAEAEAAREARAKVCKTIVKYFTAGVISNPIDITFRS
jgi:hypothetical protein